MTYFEDDFDNNNEGFIDFDSLNEEAEIHRIQLHLATEDTSIAVGIHPVDSSSFEVWADGGLFGEKTKYFYDFEDFRMSAKELYPDADWENIGW